MILKKEINAKSTKWNVPPDTVDKDWVLGHFLSAFYSIVEHKEKLVFKGGTALRKCYFPGYRFSEDLDFTSIDRNYTLKNKTLQKVIETAETHSGIHFQIKDISEMKFEDKLTGYQTKIAYWGANHSKNQEPPSPGRWLTSIKIEITLYEKMVFKPQYREISHPYSDTLINTSEQIPCYNLKEIISEKIRALIQRSYSAPRDYYDIYKLKDRFTENDWKEIKDAFIAKMKFKKLEYKNVNQLINDRTTKIVTKAWNNSLKHQLPAKDLPDVNQVIEELIKLFNKYL